MPVLSPAILLDVFSDLGLAFIAYLVISSDLDVLCWFWSPESGFVFNVLIWKWVFSPLTCFEFWVILSGWMFICAFRFGCFVFIAYLLNVQIWMFM